MSDPIRQAFEQAAKAHAGKARMDFKIMPNGGYKYLRLQFMWLGWCLAHEHEGDPTAANERGYDPCKLPPRATNGLGRLEPSQLAEDALNACLDAVEIVRVDEPEQRREVNAEPYMDDPCRGY